MLLSSFALLMIETLVPTMQEVIIEVTNKNNIKFAILMNALADCQR
jgi:hypothetical protein